MFPERWGLLHLFLFWVVLVGCWAGFTFLTKNGISYNLTIAEVVVVAVPIAITIAEVHKVFTELWLERRRKQGQDEMARAIQRVIPDDERREQINRYIEEARELLEKLDDRKP